MRIKTEIEFQLGNPNNEYEIYYNLNESYYGFTNSIEELIKKVKQIERIETQKAPEKTNCNIPDGWEWNDGNYIKWVGSTIEQLTEEEMQERYSFVRSKIGNDESNKEQKENSCSYPKEVEYIVEYCICPDFKKEPVLWADLVDKCTFYKCKNCNNKIYIQSKKIWDARKSL